MAYSSKQVENTGKKESNFSFSHSVFLWHALQTSKNQGLFTKGLYAKFKNIVFGKS